MKQKAAEPTDVGLPFKAMYFFLPPKQSQWIDLPFFSSFSSSTSDYWILLLCTEYGVAQELIRVFSLD